MLWGVRVRSLIVPVPFDLRIESFRKGSARQLAPHECVVYLDRVAHDLDVLLGHRPSSIPLETRPAGGGS